MAICIYADPDGTVHWNGVPTESCVDLIAIDAAEYTGGLVLADIFNIPPSAELSAAWAAGFTLPLIIYMSAWALGVVVNFINSK